MQLSTLERKILNYLQEDISFTAQPFQVLAHKVGIDEERLLKKIRKLKEQGLIRNFSARIAFKKLKFKSTLVAMRIPAKRVEVMAKRISRSPLVTHCYLRKGEYNLWSVFVYRNGKLHKFLKEITKEVGEKNILNLTTLRQFKLKTRIEI